ncbi:MAG: chorismate synthase [Victivallales bacterium]|nr:chorismate synthase [Victivallales bacterium]
MSSDWGKHLHVQIFGESHGPAIGVVIEGLPPGEAIDFDELASFLARRAPGKADYATSRQEADEPEYLSGLLEGRTTGAPLAALIRNTSQRSADYDGLRRVPRPGHADFPASLRYRNCHDLRGGGHFSGRLTAPLCIAGGIARQILARRGIHVGAHLLSVAEIADTPFDPMEIDAAALRQPAEHVFPVLDLASGERMQEAIRLARQEGDSLGGVIEGAAIGLPGGLGSPMFEGVENRLAALLFGVPAVRGVEFGAGFASARMRGSEHNDPWRMKDGRVLTSSNHHGGVLGGITTGMPLLVRVAIKPTPSIAKEQHSVDLTTGENALLAVRGRHDPCIAPRAVPVVESCLAVGCLDLLLEK